MEKLAGLRQRARSRLGLDLQPLCAAGALAGSGSRAQLAELERAVLVDGMRRVRWAGGDVGLADVSAAERTGCLLQTRGASSVRVAIIDSGVDLDHPHLRIEASISTCPEPVSVAARHATLCAGLIAAQGVHHRGVAPESRILNVKVARASGSMMPAWLATGIDAALDLGAHVLSISCGFDGFDSTRQRGHGWVCRSGTCLLCRAVDCATICGAVVVAAAGNLGSALTARRRGVGRSAVVDSLLCPARARSAITVGAVDRAPRPALWPATSRGRVLPGRSVKPELLACGVDVASTVPTWDGDPGDHGLGLYGRGTGTSMAAAIVAGAVALIVERRLALRAPWTPATIRRELLDRCSCTSRAMAPFPRPAPRILDLARLSRAIAQTGEASTP